MRNLSSVQAADSLGPQIPTGGMTLINKQKMGRETSVGFICLITVVINIFLVGDRVYNW